MNRLVAVAPLPTLRTGRRAVIHLLLLGGAALMIFPFIWMISTSLKDIGEVFTVAPKWIPSVLRFDNYAAAWRAAPFGRFYLNSIIVAVAVTLSQLTLGALAAYAFARQQFPGKDALFLLFLGTMMIPDQITMIPAFLLMSWLKWTNTYYALIVPNMVGAFGIFLLRQFFLTLPRELEDAAKIDGCSRLTFFRLVLLPLSKPALAAVGIFTFLHNWNSYLWPLIVTSTTSMRTLPVGLRFFVAQEGATQWTLLMAASVFVMAPVLLVFLLAQRYFIEGVSITGLKG